MKQSRNALIGLLAMSAAVAMPMAFAQEQDLKAAATAAATESATTESVPAEQAEPQATSTPSQSTAPQTTAATTETSAQASTDTAKPKTWADVDGDKDGNISKTEAAAEPAVGQIFDVADANKDSKLTPDEYKAYVAKAYGAAKPPGSGG